MAPACAARPLTPVRPLLRCWYVVLHSPCCVRSILAHRSTLSITPNTHLDTAVLSCSASLCHYYFPIMIIQCLPPPFQIEHTWTCPLLSPVLGDGQQCPPEVRFALPFCYNLKVGLISLNLRISTAPILLKTGNLRVCGVQPLPCHCPRPGWREQERRDCQQSCLYERYISP